MTAFRGNRLSYEDYKLGCHGILLTASILPGSEGTTGRPPDVMRMCLAAKIWSPTLRLPSGVNIACPGMYATSDCVSNKDQSKCWKASIRHIRVMARVCDCKSSGWGMPDGSQEGMVLPKSLPFSYHSSASPQYIAVQTKRLVGIANFIIIFSLLKTIFIE